MDRLSVDEIQRMTDDELRARIEQNRRTIRWLTLAIVAMWVAILGAWISMGVIRWPWA